jgi:hypothetical protein
VQSLFGVLRLDVFDTEQHQRSGPIERLAN